MKTLKNSRKIEISGTLPNFSGVPVSIALLNFGISFKKDFCSEFSLKFCCSSANKTAQKKIDENTRKKQASINFFTFLF